MEVRRGKGTSHTRIVRRVEGSARTGGLKAGVIPNELPWRALHLCALYGHCVEDLWRAAGRGGRGHGRHLEIRGRGAW